jgi:hypothetical protein
MVNSGNHPWRLKSLLDSLVFELDKAHDTLALKGLNRKLTYMVKDVAFDFNIFPEYDGDIVFFKTAQPGEMGASKVTVSLGSIRDNQIREISNQPLTQNQISLEDINLPEPTRKELQRLGIRSTEDLQKTVQDRKIDLNEVTDEKVDYQQLAGLINQAHRQQNPPTISKASVDRSDGQTLLTLQGKNLATAQSLDQFPRALIDNNPVEVISASEHELKLQIKEDQLQGTAQQVKVALDPYAVVTLNLKT